MNIYLVYKLLHITAVIIFLGNIFTGLFWMKQANRTNNLSIISFAIRSLIISDKWFTIPGVIVITAGGISGAIQGGIPLLKTGWIFWSIVLFTLSGIVFSAKLIPLQKKIYKVTLVAEADFNRELYHTCLKQWEAWGFIALLTPVLAMVMMILKLPLKSIF